MSRRVLVVGAGSLGSVYGGFLARAGCDVQLLARRAHARAITAAGGLWVQAPGERFLAPLRATCDPREAEPADLVIVLTKTPDTEAALGALAHLAGSVDAVLSLQNGVEKDEVLAGWCGPGAVLGAMSMVGGTLTAPGEVAQTLAGPTFVGELDGTVSDRARGLGALLERAGLEAVVTERIRSAEWSKLVHGHPSMALTALTRLDFHHVFLGPELAELFLDLVLEGAAIAAAAGVELDDWPRLLPVRTLATLPRAEALEHIHAHGRRLEDAGMTAIRISMLQSIERGRRTEVEAIQGFLTRAAARLGVAAPATTVTYRLLSGVDRHLT